MKKGKLISLLLSAAICLSSLPFITASAQTDQPAEAAVTTVSADGEASPEDTAPVMTTVLPAPSTVTTTAAAAAVSTTTTSVEEVWRWGTGVDHFASIKTKPTKVIYNEGEELDLSGLVVKAYHLANRYSNLGRVESVRTDYEWEVTDIDPEYITIETLYGEPVDKDFTGLTGYDTYVVRIGADYGMAELSVADSEYKKTVYDTDTFSFRVYINSPDSNSRFIGIDNAEIEDFWHTGALPGNNFIIKDVGVFSFNADSVANVGYNIDYNYYKGDIISGVLLVNCELNYIICGDIEILKYGGEAGDANYDGAVDMADAVLIMQSIANPNKYGLYGTDPHRLSKRGAAVADINGGGLTSSDALEIQRMLLGVIES